MQWKCRHLRPSPSPSWFSIICPLCFRSASSPSGCESAAASCLDKMPNTGRFLIRILFAFFLLLFTALHPQLDLISIIDSKQWDDDRSRSSSSSSRMGEGSSNFAPKRVQVKSEQCAKLPLFGPSSKRPAALCICVSWPLRTLEQFSSLNRFNNLLHFLPGLLLA